MKKLLIVLLILFTMGIFLACDDSDEDSSVYKFKVISKTQGFTGYYIVDGEDIKEFTDGGIDGIYYTYEKSLNNPTTIYIRADASDDSATGTSYLEIKVFEDKDQVDSISANKDIDIHLGIELYYDFSGDDSEAE